MSKYPSISGKRLIKALQKSKYVIVKRKRGKRGKASHVVVKHPQDNIKITVIIDTKDDLKKGTLGAIRRQLKLSREDFIKILRKGS
jgi:predicted RNA binding protein YcfA (HicA-like mRNA interferase family)